MFLILAIVGGSLLFAQFVCWIGLRREVSKSNGVVLPIEEPLMRDDYLTPSEVVEADGPTLADIFCGYKFYIFILLCAINIYRIRYFLGLAVYTLIDLHDKGTYLHILGYCFAVSAFVSPIADKVLGSIDS